MLGIQETDAAAAICTVVNYLILSSSLQYCETNNRIQ